MSTVTTLSWFDGDRGTVRGLLDSVEGEITAHLVPADGGTYAFLDQSEYLFDASILELVSGASVVFVPPITFYDTGDARFEAVGEPDRLSEFYDRLGRTLEASIDDVHEFRRWSSSGDVTDRQLTALETAVAVGYYDVPRTGSIADVAEALDRARSTTGELLRKAESAILSAYLESRRHGDA